MHRLYMHRNLIGMLLMLLQLRPRVEDSTFLNTAHAYKF
jgi:hypothetical protein